MRKDGFVLATNITKASEHESRYLPYMIVASCHSGRRIKRVYADKGYYGKENRRFLDLNGISDGIMRRNTSRAKLTEYEVKRNRKISKVRYIAVPRGIGKVKGLIKFGRGNKENKEIEGIIVVKALILLFHGVRQYFGLTHLHDNGFRPGVAPARKAYRARFTDILKNLCSAPLNKEFLI